MRQAIISAAADALSGRDRAPSRRNPNYKPNPDFQAIAKLVGCCRAIIDVRQTTDIEDLLSGFLDDGMRGRDLKTIRTCRDLLTELLEYADAT
jgi:hypothetical protein